MKQFLLIISSNLKRSFCVLLVVVFASHSLKAQPPLLRNFEYIETYSVQAVEQMLQYKIPASVIMAQAILESRSGTSELAMRSNNHFGIKCHLEWGGDTIRQDDDTLSECFRSYASITDSYTDHSMFLVSRPRYAGLFTLPVTDYKAWCAGLKNCGYATFPDYAEVLTTIIENFRLHELDQATTLEPKQFTAEPPQIKLSAPKNTRLSLQDMAKANVLFSDEKDLHLRSLLHYIRKG